jgi:S-adenosylmethionine:tRNA ribosyltransferase-isomerase
MKREININDYAYSLPQERIALFPLRSRDQSKLLFYNKGKITHEVFSSLPQHLPDNSLLFFNDTKVIPARLHFKKDTGAEIEIFLLSPVAPSSLLVEVMQVTDACSWKCTIGNLKRWTEGTILKKKINNIELEADLKDRETGLVEFRWTGKVSFAELIHQSGEVPLPPYLKRKPEASDVHRYQTVYAHYEGAVAAPTAGLHFTPEVLADLKSKNIQTDFLTLHVSAGTFQPVKVDNASEHVMHKEQVLIDRQNIENLLQPGKTIIPVGTTAMRTLESLYWFGAKLMLDPDEQFLITQTDPYYYRANAPSANEAFIHVQRHMTKHNIDILRGETSIYIMPGYSFKVCKGLITNFHQPGSTLILLVAAFVGEDWKTIYSQALNNNYRFLSYGDSSLLLPK